jgi:hypothetical protein
MFSLRDIDDQIYVFKSAADSLEEKADDPHVTALMGTTLRCHANGLREAARSLARMIEHEVEREAREAMR